jgi:hypothetical protein
MASSSRQLRPARERPPQQRKSLSFQTVFLCNQYYDLSTIETVYWPGYYLFYKNRFAVHDQTLRIFHIWIAGADELRHYCGKAIVEASISPEWAVNTKCDLICPDCLRMLQVELDSKTNNRPDLS